jgi:hypothetical protein
MRGLPQNPWGFAVLYSIRESQPAIYSPPLISIDVPLMTRE